MIDLDRLFGPEPSSASTVSKAGRQVVAAVPVKLTESDAGASDPAGAMAGAVVEEPVVEEPRGPWIDDRRRCLDCHHLKVNGRCGGADLGLLPDVDWPYRPVPDVLRRCEGFVGLPASSSTINDFGSSCSR